MDILPNLLTAIVMGIPVYMMNSLPINRLALLFLQVVVGAIVYAILSLVTKNENFYAFIKFIKNRQL